MVRRLVWTIVSIMVTWAGGVRLAEASCAATSVHVSVDPLVFPTHVIPVRWSIDPSCEVIETGLLLGRDPSALAPAGPPLYGPHPAYQQDLPVEESGRYWIAAYARDETGAVVRSEPHPVSIFVPPLLPDDPRGSHGPLPFYTGTDADFLQPAGEPHYASLRRAVVRNQRFVTETLPGFPRSEGADFRTIASTHRAEVLAQQAPPLEVGGAIFPVNPADVLATLDGFEAFWGGLRYPRLGLYNVICHVSARFLPTPDQQGPRCVPQDFPVTGWVAYGEVRAPGGFQSIRSTLTYVIPRPPSGKRVQSAKLRVFAFRQRGLLQGIPVNGKVPVDVEVTSTFCDALGVCTPSGWVTWDFTAEARALASQGGGELPLTLDPVPPENELANYGLSPRWNYPWEHGTENHALTLTFEADCPRELTLRVTPSVVRPIIPDWLSSTTGRIIRPTIKGPARETPTEAMVEATAKTCAPAGQTPQPVEVTFAVQGSAAGTSGAAGHLHASLPRPTGLIQDLDRGQATDLCTVTTFTDGTGSCAVKYRAGEVSGVETIVARADGFAEAQATVTVKVPGLQNFATFNAGIWRLTGALPGLHTDNHWATPNTISKTALMAAQVHEDFSASMGVNDMSLVWGGLFDVRGDWDGSFHRTHRLGTGVDIDGCALSLVPDNPNPRSNKEKECPVGWVVLPKKDYFEGVCMEQGGTLAKEATIHCEFPQ